MTTHIVSPLPGWNVRGFSYGELQPDGQPHPGADLNVGYGDDDLGLPVVCFAAGTVAELRPWDGVEYGLGNVALVEHTLFGSSHPIKLWSMYAHLDSFADSLREGSPIAAGDPIGACGKSGFQSWAHLHFELRYVGPPEMPATYWGGRLTYEAQSRRYADPFTLLRVLEGAALHDAQEDLVRRLSQTEHDLHITQIDRERNYSLKMEMESYLRRLEHSRRIRRGTTDRLIKRIIG